MNGRSFTASLPMDAPFLSGDLVLVTTDDGQQVCGQIHGKSAEGAGQASASGAVLGALVDGRLQLGPVSPFSAAVLGPAPADLWAQVLETGGSTMRVGSARGGPAQLRPKGFSRHTFMCGQSGSGKSYSLGVLLEQVILDTELPMVILDPNADFVRLSEPHDGSDTTSTDRLSTTDIDVLRPSHEPGAPNRLCVLFGELTLRAKAAALHLDPLLDREEYDALLDAAEELRTRRGEDVIQDLLASEAPADILLAQRMKNLGVLEWDVWARDDRAVTEHLTDGSRVTVLDLSGFELPGERLVVALDVLDHLWTRRKERKPMLLVIDEAHNVCSADPATALERATTERLVQIANEGRKYGLWLLLCTQRPSRINPAVLSQCDNLVLMRMNSRGDLARLEEIFGFAPPEMLATAPFFSQGECLVAGGLSAIPTFVRMRERRTAEGGSDVPVPLPG